MTLYLPAALSSAIERAHVATSAARTALTGPTTAAAARKAQAAIAEALQELQTLDDALPLAIARLKAERRHAEQRSRQIKAHNAKVLAERERAA